MQVTCSHESSNTWSKRQALILWELLWFWKRLLDTWGSCASSYGSCTHVLTTSLRDTMIWSPTVVSRLSGRQWGRVCRLQGILWNIQKRVPWGNCSYWDNFRISKIISNLWKWFLESFPKRSGKRFYGILRAGKKRESNTNLSAGYRRQATGQKELPNFGAGAEYPVL